MVNLHVQVNVPVGREKAFKAAADMLQALVDHHDKKYAMLRSVSGRPVELVLVDSEEEARRP